MEEFRYLFYGFYFILIVFLTFFVPGNLIVKKLKLPSIINFTSSIILGMSMFAILGFFFGFLGLRNLTYFYLIITFLAWIKFDFKIPKYKTFHLLSRDKLKDNLPLLAVFIIGIFLQLPGSIANAIPIKNGLFFCCGGADTLYHVALIKNLITDFPPFEPGIYNLPLHNYHFLSNLLIADLVRVFKLPLLFTEFQLIPIFMSILLGLSAYSCASLISKNKNYRLFFLILVFFFSDIFYLLTLFTAHKLTFNIETVETSLSLWVSYTRYFGVVFFFQALSFLILWINNKKFIYFLPLLLVGGGLIGFKVYIGLLFLSGMGFLLIYYLFKKEIKMLISILGIFLLSFLIYFPVNSSSGGIIFTGFWRTRDFIVSPFLNLFRLELARRIFESASNPKRYFFDILFLFIYIFFSFGILLSSFLNPISRLKTIPIQINIFLISGFISTFILGMFFIQSTGGANSGQFLISVFLVGIIYSSLFLENLFNKNSLIAKVFVILLVLLMLPKTIHIANSHFKNIQVHQYNFVSTNTLVMFRFINSSLENKSVFIIDPKLGKLCLLLPIFTQSKSYFCNEGAPVDRGINTKSYDKHVQSILKSKKKIEAKNIDYILVSANKILPRKHKIIYKNPEFLILKYD